MFIDVHAKTTYIYICNQTLDLVTWKINEYGYLLGLNTWNLAILENKSVWSPENLAIFAYKPVSSPEHLEILKHEPDWSPENLEILEREPY